MNITQTASGLPWQLRANDERTVLAMAQQQGISELLASILVGRGVALDAAARFLNPSLREDMPNPSHLLDMDKAVSRIIQAIRQNQPIAVFGDYDVDGATSTALLHAYFAQLGIPIRPYIPDRMKEGYGPTVEGFRRIIEGFGEGGARRSVAPSPLRGGLGRGRSQPNPRPPTEIPPSTDENNRKTEQGDFDSPARGEWEQATPPRPLILTVDCGTMAHEPIAYAQAQGVDVIVIDHHLSSGALPDAYAVVNPNRADETSPLTNLAAVGVTFMLLVALNKRLRESQIANREVDEGKEAGSIAPLPNPSPAEGEGTPEQASPPPLNSSPPNLLSSLDLVALGTVCDVMPLVGLNRTFVTQGLKVLSKRGNVGLAALADVARMNELPGTYHLGFLLGPRINAGGRVGESGLGVELLTTPDADHARAIAQRLDQYNAERQAIEASVLEQALAQAVAQENMPVLVIAGEGWHQGVIGIVAGRIKEKYARPTAVISLENGIGKASARSVTGADIGAAIHAAHAQGLIEKGGGHAMAAGFSLAEHQIPALHAFLIARLGAAVAAYTDARVMKLDGWISCQSATLALLDDIARAGPYGIGNPSPRFAVRAAKIVRTDILKEKHLRCILTDAVGSQRLTAMAFNAVGTPLGQWLQTHRQLHLLGELKRNFWQGEESVQFMISDAGL